MRKRIVMVSLSILLLFSQCVWAEDPVSIETGETQKMELVAVPEDQYGTADLEGIEKYGNVTLSILCQDFLDAGYQYGDVVTVSFLDQSLDIPFCSDYFNVNTGEAVLVAKDQEPNLKLAVCLGDFASTYGIAAKTVEDDETITWNYADGVDGPVEFCISMKEPGGYYGMYLAHLLDYSDERSDFPDLTDEQFAGNSSGVAMRYKLLGLEQLTRIKERWFREALRQRMRGFVRFMACRSGYWLDAEQVRMIFTRSLPANELESAQTLAALKDILPAEELERRAMSMSGMR